METKWAVQCGNEGGRLTCLVGFTDDREYLKGRICVQTAETTRVNDRVVYLRQMCYIGDVMNECPNVSMAKAVR